MSRTAKKSDPALWERVKAEITEGDRGGRPGRWSARKAQLAAHEYQARGGGYEGPKDPDNHLQHWTDEKWGTESGARSQDSGERYLPEAARRDLSDSEYRRTTAKKRRDERAGRPVSRQPADIAAKAARHRDRPATKKDLLAEARRREIPGRSKMSRAELERALRG